MITSRNTELRLIDEFGRTKKESYKKYLMVLNYRKGDGEAVNGGKTVANWDHIPCLW